MAKVNHKVKAEDKPYYPYQRKPKPKKKKNV
jgi:hypothetical protein